MEGPKGGPLAFNNINTKLSNRAYSFDNETIGTIARCRAAHPYFSFNGALNYEYLKWTSSVCLNLNFPPNFKFGAATSAYQIEGGWNASDKGVSIWDSTVHKDPSVVVDGSNGDVACNSYYLWKEDVRLAQELGLHFYRFSLSWTRIMPTGFSDKISKDGISYYNKLINRLLNKGIEPMITLYHFDLPQSIQDLGGWTNPLIVDWFADYARTVFSSFADRVKIFLTINEPLIICDYIYSSGKFVPVILEQQFGPFLCNKYVLLAHADAKAWRIYDEEYKKKYHGKVSIANNPVWLEAGPDVDEELIDLAREFGVGRYSHPIYSKEGGWPPSVETFMEDLSKKQGFPFSRLPSFTEEEKKFIQGTYDFYSLNHYTSRVARRAHHGEVPGPWFFEGSKELNIVLDSDPAWQKTDFNLITLKPEGLRRQIAWIQRKYGKIGILISENGMPTKSEKIDDVFHVLLAIYEDGANIIGYTVWSLMDNFEWTSGYTMKFGLYHVDFKDPLRKRTPRASAYYYASIIKHHSLNVTYNFHHRVNSQTDGTNELQASLVTVILSYFINKIFVSSLF